MESPSRDEVIACVFGILRDEILTAGEGFTPQSNLVDAGLESLGLTQAMLAIEEQTGIWVDESLLTPEHLATSETLGDLVYSQLADG
jgi:acyl carrier protein